MSRATRILAVTAGLAAAGAIFGAIAGAVALFVVGALSNQISNAADFGILAFPAFFGAVIGAIAAPAAGFLLLRSVPLGRAVGWTTLGAVAGGIGGWFLAVALRTQAAGGLHVLGNAVLTGVAGAVAGFVVAALLARRRSSRTPETDASETPAARGGR